MASSNSETTLGDVHIHLAVKNNDNYNDFIYLRDYLINNPNKAKEYMQIKYKIAKESNYNREQYKLLKSEYVVKLIKEARDYFNSKNKSLL